MREISIVIPVYNSEDNLIELDRQIGNALKSVSHELILINDGSTDRSWEIIEGIFKKNKNVIGINLRKNSGQDNAIMAGLGNVSGNYIVIMDDDLQHSPYDIQKMYDKCKEGYDVCYGNFIRKKQAFWKNAGSWFNGKIAEILINKPKHIYLSPFEIIRREVADEVIKYGGPYPYVQGLILDVTRNVSQIVIEHHKRHQGKGNFNLVKSISVFLKLATSFSVFPLRMATFSGSITALCGFFLIPYYLYQYFFEDRIIEGWTTLVILLLIIGGLMLISLGLIGEYLGRMYLNINKKPQYVIKNILKRKETG